MKFGPATMVTAAFIGPGTVTICTIAGFHHGYTLLWVLVLATFTTIIFQGIAARIGFATNMGVSEVLDERLKSPIARVFAFGLIIAAVLVGNAAYEAGNIAGGGLGLEALLSIESLSTLQFKPINLVIGIIAFILLWRGSYKLLEKFLVAIVAIMTLCFIVSAILVVSDISELLKGFFIPTVPNGDILSIIALMGTTVVPYNLFLHASIINEAANKSLTLKEIQLDTLIAVIIGAIISLAIIIVGSSVAGEIDNIQSAKDLALGMSVVLGDAAKFPISIGLLAAGLTSAVTAPLAAGYAISGLFRKSPVVFKGSWLIVLLTGIIFSSLDYSSIVIIRFAQVANGILLPLIVVYLLWIANQEQIMGKYKNSVSQNITALFVLLVVILLLSFRTFVSIIS